jgi:hypothetical protein
VDICLNFHYHRTNKKVKTKELAASLLIHAFTFIYEYTGRDRLIFLREAEWANRG